MDRTIAHFDRQFLRGWESTEHPLEQESVASLAMPRRTPGDDVSDHRWAPMPVQQPSSEQGPSSLALAALLMSSVFCLPVLPLMAMVLAVIALLRR